MMKNVIYQHTLHYYHLYIHLFDKSRFLVNLGVTAAAAEEEVGVEAVEEETSSSDVNDRG
jgi:hypothetical protein